MLVQHWLAWTFASVLLESSAIHLIENMIDFIINTRKHTVGPENNQQHITEINSALRG
jgi:hypothetical protein